MKEQFVMMLQGPRKRTKLLGITSRCSSIFPPGNNLFSSQ